MSNYPEKYICVTYEETLKPYSISFENKRIKEFF